MSHILPTLESLCAEATRFTKSLSAHPNHATLVVLSGELGAGKTSYAQAVARALGVSEPVTSPTFVLEKTYPLPADGVFKTLVHIDAYRLEGEPALTPLGFFDRYESAQNLILLEWPEMVAAELPVPDHHITLSVYREGRTITYA